MTSIEFARPGFLYALTILPFWALLVWPWAHGGVLYTRGESAGIVMEGWRGRAALILGLPRLLRLGAIAALLVALAHPRLVEVVEETVLRGKSTVIAVDISSSMLADDMENENTRLVVAREAAVRFAEARTLDELSLVAFAGRAVRRVPPTTDPDLIVAGIESLEVQLVLDGTDISSAMLTSIASALDSDRDDRVIVLLTDGAHNGTGVLPLTTAQAAAALGMRVHSIALLGEIDMETASPAVLAAARRRQGLLETEMETVLTGISRITGGRYYRASSATALDSIYREIGDIEQPVEEVVQRTEYRSQRVWPLLLALVLIGLDVALRGSRWAVVP